MRNVSIDTKNISESGYKALLENGYEVELEDVFVRLDEDTSSFVLIAIAKKNNKSCVFKMLLSDSDFVCVQDDSIRIDLSKYKNDDKVFREASESFDKMIRDRTPLDWAKKYTQYISDFIELNEEDSERYPIKTIEDEFESLIEQLDIANVKCKDFLSNELFEKLQEIIVNPKLRKYLED